MSKFPAKDMGKDNEQKPDEQQHWNRNRRNEEKRNYEVIASLSGSCSKSYSAL